MTEITVEVTAADITAGQPGSVGDSHPIALAARRALGLGPRRPPYIGVGADWFSILVKGSFYESHTLPGGARDWIYAYDHKQPAGPFSFTFRTAWGTP